MIVDQKLKISIFFILYIIHIIHIMLIYRNKIDGKLYIFIHIPKNAGKYIRTKIKNDINNVIIHDYWGVETHDEAHLPYMERKNHIHNNTNYNYYAYSRNPYDRTISAFFYLNPNKTIDDFKYFCKNVLINYDFNLDFNPDYIHYYPQYLFVVDVCSDSLELEEYNALSKNNIDIKKIEDCETPKHYDLIKYYDEDCIKIINKIYRYDFVLFKYDVINSFIKSIKVVTPNRFNKKN